MTVIGPVVAVVGVLLVLFNKQFGAWVRRVGLSKPFKAGWQPAALYEPRPSGTVPIVVIIGAGWVVIGILFTLVGLGIIPE